MGTSGLQAYKIKPEDLTPQHIIQKNTTKVLKGDPRHMLYNGPCFMFLKIEIKLQAKHLA